PTLRAGFPRANPSSYLGSSPCVGTPIAVGIGIPFFIGFAEVVV
ncbi:MAG: sodium-dependent bicarbonate transport family permease, partial [Pseudomonadota bacterium]